MGDRAVDRLAMVRSLIETAPDGALRTLEGALRMERAGGAMASIRDIIGKEVVDRQVRDRVFEPLLPLCRARTDGLGGVQFPASVLTRLWRGLKQAEPKAAAAAWATLDDDLDDDTPQPSLDKLCRAAAAGLRAGRKDVVPAVEALEGLRPGAAEQFASLLDLAPLARTAIRRLPVWIKGMNEDHAAAARLTFKDADALTPGGGPWLMEILLAQLNEPWRVLRLISAVTSRAGDRYLASSEMAGFCERVLDDIDRRLAVIRGFDLDAGPPGAAAAAQAVNVAAAEIGEFEEGLDLAKDGPYGQRLAKQKLAMATLAEGLLKQAPRAVAEALPIQPVRQGRPGRTEPQLRGPPDPCLVGRAMAALAFYDGVRLSAPQGGYGTVRNKVAEELTLRLNAYVEDAVGVIHAGVVGDPAVARAFVEAAAQMIAVVQDPLSAQIVRRRAAAA